MCLASVDSHVRVVAKELGSLRREISLYSLLHDHAIILIPWCRLRRVTSIILALLQHSQQSCIKVHAADAFLVSRIGRFDHEHVHLDQVEKRMDEFRARWMAVES